MTSTPADKEITPIDGDTFAADRPIPRVRDARGAHQFANSHLRLEAGHVPGDHVAGRVLQQIMKASRMSSETADHRRKVRQIGRLRIGDDLIDLVGDAVINLMPHEMRRRPQNHPKEHDEAEARHACIDEREPKTRGPEYPT